MKKASPRRSAKLSKTALHGQRVLVTAGPTREYFDPVRFLSNPSSGKMGYAIAEAAVREGAGVTLISGPVSLKPPRGVRLLRVTTAEEMYRAVMCAAPRMDLIFMVAAVSDWRPAYSQKQKAKKRGQKRLVVTLLPTKDILKELGRRKRKGQLLIGFAAETERLISNAREKLRRKNLDAIVVNRVGRGLKTSGFETDKNRLTVLTQRGGLHRFPHLTKRRAAKNLIKLIKLSF